VAVQIYFLAGDQYLIRAPLLFCTLPALVRSAFTVDLDPASKVSFCSLSVSGRMSRLTSSVGRNVWFAPGQALEGRRESSHLRACQHISSTIFCGNNVMSHRNLWRWEGLKLAASPGEADLCRVAPERAGTGGSRVGAEDMVVAIAVNNPSKLALVWPTFRVPPICTSLG